MTEWRQWPSWRRLAAIARAPVTGAAAAGSIAAAALVDLVEAIGDFSPESYPGAILEIANELAASQPSIAPLVNLANTVHLRHRDGPELLAGELRAAGMRMDASAGVLSRVGSALIPARATVLTMGASGSVHDLLSLAAASRAFSVACAETMPYGEGIELAADLVTEGLRVEVVPDDQVLDVLPGADLVVIGAAAIGPAAALTIVGSAAVAEEAQGLEIPVYVVASVEKALPSPLFDRAVTGAAGQFELVPLEQIRSVVTEIGVLDGRSAGSLAAERTVARSLVGELSRSHDG